MVQTDQSNRSGVSPMPIPKASQALARFTVLDLTRVRAGPTCVRQLADWGANVIKIEMPPDEKGGDAPGGPRDGSDFQNLHRNKRSIDAQPEGQGGPGDVPASWSKKADVVVENFRPDVKRRLKVDYEDVKKVNPRIVYGSISGFGQDGPYANRPGVDQIAQGMGGLMSITGLPGQGPVRVGIPVADLTAGLFCALGIMMALLEREKSDEGPAGRDLAAGSADLHARLPGGALADRQARSPSRPATTIRPSIPTGVFKTTDGHINIAATGGAIWRAVLPGARRRGIACSEPDYQNAKSRSQNRKELNAAIGDLSRSTRAALSGSRS